MTDAAIEIFCPVCGYDLRGGGSGRCPECGTSIDHETLARSRIPWSHRQQIGRFRAYWRTVWLATFHAKKLAQEASKPVDYRDARLFRVITILVAGLPVAALVWFGVTQIKWDELTSGVLTQPSMQPPTRLLDVFLPFTAVAAFAPFLPACALLFFWAATGAVSEAFYTRALPLAQQNRAMAISQYSCAPLALLPIALTLGLLGVLLEAPPLRPSISEIKKTFEIFSGLMVVASLFLWWLTTLRLLRHATHASPLRMLAAAVGVPALLFILTGIILGVVPWIVGLLVVAIESLR
jgi:hypothetical protein